MILLQWHKSAATAPGIALLFGSGLIGGGVAQALQQVGPDVTTTRLPWNWDHPDPSQARSIKTAIQAAHANAPDARLSVIWAAGRSGFGSLEEDMQAEFSAFERVLDLTRHLGSLFEPARRAFLHVSSAGGLFEGQVACGRDTSPKPLRPYGHGKLAQEQAVRADATLGHRLILRPSSVYGHGRGARRGLVSALVAAGIDQRSATIFGALTTQRDYIYAPDIGRFIAARVLGDWPPFLQDADPNKVETVLLASGRPASVFEILHLVQQHLGKTLYLRIDPHPDNARDNTFAPMALPRDFHPTGLAEGVTRTATALIGDRMIGGSL